MFNFVRCLAGVVFECDFDDQSTCGLTHIGYAALSQSRERADTGPSEDHTSNSDGVDGLYC